MAVSTLRFYLTDTVTPYTPSGIHGGFEDKTTSTKIYKLDTAKGTTVGSSAVAETNNTNPYDVFLGRWVSAALTVATTFPTATALSYCIGTQTSNTASGASLYFHIWLTVGDSNTERGILVSDTAVADKMSATAEGQAYTVTTTGAVSASVGDRIVVEIGYRDTDTATTSYTSTMWYGGAGADATDTGDETTQASWIDMAFTNPSPTVVLNTPADDDIGVSLTPDLVFTGTDVRGMFTAADEVEYEVQVDTSSSFPASAGTINVGAGDGGVGVDNATWAGAHAATTATTAEPTQTVSSLVARSNSGTTYTIARAFFPIDTSGIIDGANITSATFSFYIGTLYQNLGSCTYCLVQTDQPSNTTLTTADINNCGAETGATEGATRITPAAGWNTFTLNATGLSWISKTGFTKLGVRVSIDVDNTPAVDGVTELDSTFQTSEGTNKPYLTVNYTNVLDILSSTDADANWAGTGAPNPFPSGNEITYTVPVASALAAGIKHYWRVRAIDPLGSNTWGAWSPGAHTGYSEFTTASAAAGPANLKTWNGLAKASISKINGLAIANIKSINGLQ